MNESREPFVELKSETEPKPVRLYVGDIIGRGRAALHVSDPRVSEAHALISMRSGALRVIPLRGGVFRRSHREGAAGLLLRDLSPGAVFFLAEGFKVPVELVSLHEPLTGYELKGLRPERIPLSSNPEIVYTLYPGSPWLLSGKQEDGLGVLWRSGSEWKLRRSEEHQPMTVVLGKPVSLGGEHSIQILTELDRTVTWRQHQNLSIKHHANHTDIGLIDLVDVRIKNTNHRIFTVLLRHHLAHTRDPHCHPAGLPWRELAAEIWPEYESEKQRRGLLDANLVAIRKRIRAADISRKIVVMSNGELSLSLEKSDRVRAPALLSKAQELSR